MDWGQLGNWFLFAVAAAIFVVMRARRRESAMKPDEIEGVLHRSFDANAEPGELRAILEETMARLGYPLHSATSQRLVFDSSSMGFFHWGFLYIFDLPTDEDGTVTVSIYGKGPNPPGESTMAERLDACLADLRYLPMTPRSGAASS